MSKNIKIGSPQYIKNNNLNLILITNQIEVALLAQSSGVDRVMVDLEKIGKLERQGHLDTLISDHSEEDITLLRNILSESDLMVRVNPINDMSQLEVNNVIKRGADIVMLPMFKSVSDVGKFIQYVDKRAVVSLLLETKEALMNIDNLIELSGIDEIHIGLNDLHLSMGLSFMFEFLTNGILDDLSYKIKKAGIKFGFGGIARMGHGSLDSSIIISEHARLGSCMAILSRDFHNKNINLSEEIFKIRNHIKFVNSSNVSEKNHIIAQKRIQEIVKIIKNKKKND